MLCRHDGGQAGEDHRRVQDPAEVDQIGEVLRRIRQGVPAANMAENTEKKMGQWHDAIGTGQFAPARAEGPRRRTPRAGRAVARNRVVPRLSAAAQRGKLAGAGQPGGRRKRQRQGPGRAGATRRAQPRRMAAATPRRKSSGPAAEKAGQGRGGDVARARRRRAAAIRIQAPPARRRRPAKGSAGPRSTARPRRRRQLQETPQPAAAEANVLAAGTGDIPQRRAGLEAQRQRRRGGCDRVRAGNRKHALDGCCSDHDAAVRQPFQRRRRSAVRQPPKRPRRSAVRKAGTTLPPIRTARPAPTRRRWRAIGSGDSRRPGRRGIARQRRPAAGPGAGGGLGAGGSGRRFPAGSASRGRRRQFRRSLSGRPKPRPPRGPSPPSMPPQRRSPPSRNSPRQRLLRQREEQRRRRERGRQASCRGRRSRFRRRGGRDGQRRSAPRRARRGPRPGRQRQPRRRRRRGRRHRPGRPGAIRRSESSKRSSR